MKDLICQAVSWYCCDHVFGDDDDEKYLVKLFAVTQEGQRLSVNITGFTPFFFIKVPFKVNDMMIIRFKTYVTNCLPASLKAALINVKLFKKKEFYGFHHEDMFYFLRFTFNNMKAWRAGIKVFQKVIHIGSGIRPMKYKLYESTIEPHLRMMHIRDILPAGWIKVKAGNYSPDSEVLPTRCHADYTCAWTKMEPWHIDNIAPLCVASFDLECMSSHGDFPVPVKDYRKVANEILSNISPDVDSEFLHQEIIKIFLEPEARKDARLSVVYPKDEVSLPTIERKVKMHIDDIQNIIRGLIVFDGTKYVAKGDTLVSRDDILKNLTHRLNNMGLPAVEGDKIIQIGTTVHKYGDKTCSYKNIITLGSCDPIEGVDVIVCQTEAEMILKWRDLIREVDPDVITGYNIFGFDFSYLYQRACELNINNMLCDIGRIQDHICSFEEKNLSSSALGENLFKFIDMQGRVLIDLMKIVQREHKLDSYKLDNVANHFMNMNKHDVHPNDIFRLYKGNSADRRVIAEYCIQDCALCNMLMMKLETLANSIGMANVCNVPLSYIIMRGQGIKIFSLVAKQCREDGFIIPTLYKGGTNAEGGEEDDEGYEGAIVLEPQCGIYIDDPVSVLDYASLYPSSMISENLSHDTIVLDPKYDNLPGLDYVDISYDIFEGAGDKKQKVGVKTCRYVQTEDKGVLPRILMKLLRQRKETRKKIEYKTVTLGSGQTVVGLVKEKSDKIMVTSADGRSLGEWDIAEVVHMDDTYNEFQKAVLDGLQVAYKVTANSLYGQCGAKTSSIYMKEVAASTTATGRNMIIKARDFILQHFQGSKIIYGDSVTGTTPTILRINNRIVFETFENIATRFGGGKWLQCLTGKEACELDNVEVWSKSGWTKVYRIIRHTLAPQKKIIRVRTQSSYVDVTDDHSLFLENGKAISPKNVVPGMSLMMREYPYVDPIDFEICGSEEEARIMGFFLGYGKILQNSVCVYSWTIHCPDQAILRTYKEQCENVYPAVTWNLEEYKLYPSVKAGDSNALKSLMISYQMLFGNRTIPDALMNANKNIRHAFWKGLVELNTNINGYPGDTTHALTAQIDFLKYSLGYKTNHSFPSRVISMTQVPYSGYVYDFTTENHSFQAGVGKIIVSNTDSLFVQFDIKDEHGNKITGKEAIPLSRKLGIQASTEIKKIIKKPHDLEWEKLFYPFILLSKKRYIANKYEHDDNKFKQTSMGVVMRRRDNSQIVKTMYGGVVDVILNERDITNSLNFLSRSLQDLIDAKFPLEEFIITKSLKSEYKDPNKIAHKVLADRMKARDPGSAPQVNDRIPYVYIEVPGGGKKMLQGDRIEHPEYIRTHNLKPDFEFYLTNQIMNPILQIYALVVEDLPKYNKGRDYFSNMFPKILREKEGDKKKAKERWNDLREEEVKKLLFDPFLVKLKNKREGFKDLMQFLKIG